MKKKKLSYKKIIVLVLIILLVTIGSPTLAKFVKEEFHSYYLNSKHFYFTSNRLKKNNPTYLVNNWSGVGAFNISFDLLSVKNSLVYTDYDIPYTVTYNCPQDVTCSLDKSSGTIYRTSNTHSDTVTLSVTPSRSYGEGERLQIGLTASSTSPYVETIRATFEYVVGKQGITYEIEDEANRPYMVFKITNAINYCKVITAFGNYQVNQLLDNTIYRQLSDADKVKCIGENVVLNFNPNVIILDTTANIVNTATLGNTTIGGISYVSMLDFYIEPVSTMAIKFYKKNVANNYTYPSGNNSSIITVTFPS